jgi:hypothetical protein
MNGHGHGQADKSTYGKMDRQTERLEKTDEEMDSQKDVETEKLNSVGRWT